MSSTEPNAFMRRSDTARFVSTGNHSTAVQNECQGIIEDLSLKELKHSHLLVDVPYAGNYKVAYASDIEDKTVECGSKESTVCRKQDLNEEIHNEIKYAMQNFKDEIKEVVEEIVTAKLNERQ